MEDAIQPTTPPQVSAVPPVQNTPPYSYGKKNWKKWIVICVVIGIILYGLVYYFVLSKQSSNPYSTNYTAPTVQPTQVQDASPVPNGTGETANWKTYKSWDGLFTINFPPQWIFSEGDKNEYNRPPTYQKVYGSLSYDLNNTSVEANFNLFSPFTFSSGIWQNVTEAEFYNPDSKARPLGIHGGGVSMIYLKPEEKYLGNSRFMKQESYTAPNQGNSYEGGEINYNARFYEYSILINDKVLSIRYSFDTVNPNKEQLNKEFEQILSTFKFTQ